MSIIAMEKAHDLSLDDRNFEARQVLVDAIAEAKKLEQAQKQEPVAMQMDVIVVNLVREGINKHRARELAEHFIKHTSPPQRQPLTVDEVWQNDELMALNAQLGCGMDLLMEIVEVIEAAHGIKGEA
jgi:hypothetical protein